jgi:hypothetical protein
LDGRLACPETLFLAAVQSLFLSPKGSIRNFFGSSVLDAAARGQA